MEKKVKSRSKYMGSIINPKNRNEYLNAQRESFKERYVNDVVNRRQEILDQEDKSDEEIANEVEEFNNNQISEEDLEVLAENFAKYQSLKELKHLKAYIKGKQFFTFRGVRFPVLTEKFLEDTQSIKEIIKVNEDE